MSFVLRTLFYSALTILIVYAAYVPVWTIFCVLIGDYMQAKLRNWFGKSKEPKFKVPEYKGTIKLQRKAQNQADYLASQLEKMGFRVTSNDGELVSFSGTRKTYVQNGHSTVLQMAQVEERPELITKPRWCAPSIKVNNIPPASKEKPEKPFDNFEDFSDFVKSSSLHISKALQKKIDEKKEVLENDRTEVSTLSIGNSGWVTPYAVQLNSKDRRFYIKPKSRLSEDKNSEFTVKVTRNVGGYELDLSELPKGYVWAPAQINVDNYLHVESLSI